MSLKRTSKITITDSYCHQEVISLFQRYVEENDKIFIGITSDIDNLGTHVATYGRAISQNLVDYYTNIIIDYLFKYQKIVNEDNFVFIPAGEEVTILALVKKESEFNQFIDGLRDFVAEKIYSLRVIEKGTTGIAFGGKTFPDNRFYEMVTTFINNLENNDYIPTKDYYDILNRIRSDISIFIDRQKFANFELIEDSDFIFLRNVIYSQLINYKINTMELLNNIAPLLGTMEIDNKLKTEYGIDKESKILIEDMIKLLQVV